LFSRGHLKVLSRIAVSVVVPAYNQKDKLEGCVNAVQRSLMDAGISSFEIIIAEDGSHDGSFEEAQRLWRKYPFVKVSHANRKTGRGSAVCRGFTEANGELVAYIDADQATETSHLPALLDAARKTGIATGSRYLKASAASRGVRRLLFSRIFNWLVRVMLDSRVSDHQCGFKAFRRGVAKDLCARTKERHWLWDTEIIVLAQRQGLVVSEIPVVWCEQGNTTVRLKNDVWEMFWGIVRLRQRL